MDISSGFWKSALRLIGRDRHLLSGEIAIEQLDERAGVAMVVVRGPLLDRLREQLVEAELRFVLLHQRQHVL